MNAVNPPPCSLLLLCTRCTQLGQVITKGPFSSVQHIGGASEEPVRSCVLKLSQNSSSAPLGSDGWQSSAINGWTSPEQRAIAGRASSRSRVHSTWSVGTHTRVSCTGVGLHVSLYNNQRALNKQPMKARHQRAHLGSWSPQPMPRMKWNNFHHLCLP